LTGGQKELHQEEAKNERCKRIKGGLGARKGEKTPNGAEKSMKITKEKTAIRRVS